MSLLNNNKRCAICQTKNKQKKTKVCEDCKFVNDFVVKWGRETLRDVLNAHLLEKSNNGTNIVLEKKDPEEVHKCKASECSCHSRSSFSRHQSLYNPQGPCAPPYQG
jgi:hypothetical protein